MGGDEGKASPIVGTRPRGRKARQCGVARLQYACQTLTEAWIFQLGNEIMFHPSIPNPLVALGSHRCGDVCRGLKKAGWRSVTSTRDLAIEFAPNHRVTIRDNIQPAIGSGPCCHHGSRGIFDVNQVQKSTFRRWDRTTIEYFGHPGYTARTVDSSQTQNGPGAAGAEPPQKFFRLQMHSCPLSIRTGRRVLVDPAAITLVVNAGGADIADVGLGRDDSQKIPQPADLRIIVTLAAAAIVADGNQDLVDAGQVAKCPTVGPINNQRLDPFPVEDCRFGRVPGACPHLVPREIRHFRDMSAQVPTSKYEGAGRNMGRTAGFHRKSGFRGGVRHFFRFVDERLQ